ncbi:hypothetical protein YPPY47_4307, partial [Yersinia pestis PY-47]
MYGPGTRLAAGRPQGRPPGRDRRGG